MRKTLFRILPQNWNKKLFYILHEDQPHLMRVYVSTCSMRSLADCFLMEGESITVIALLSTAAIFGPK